MRYSTKNSWLRVMPLPLVPVEKLLLFVALPLVPFRTVVWAKPVPATKKKTALMLAICFFMQDAA
jgi:hypothetical protein